MKKLKFGVLRWVAGGGVALLAILLTGCRMTGHEGVDIVKSNNFSAVPGDPSATNAVVPTENPRIAKGDFVRITFSGLRTQNQLLPHEERVKEDGTLTLPDIGVVKAEGKTTGELQKEIHDLYVPDYYTRLTVTVSTEQQLYYVQGQVRLPGRQPYVGRTTVLQAIASAGDFTDFADRRNVVLTRADGTQITVNCIRAASDPEYDLPIFPGDKIEVKQRGPFSGF